MIKQKLKDCNGIGLAFGFKGCGKPTLKREHGLCDSCRYDFYTKDERGKVEFEKRKIKVEKNNWKEKKKVLKNNTKKLSDYASDLQKEINTIVRLIDKNTLCISTLKPLNQKFDAGHFYSCGSNPSLRYHLDNIHAQSVYANQYLSGDQLNYLNGLEIVYGVLYKEHVVGLKKRYPVLKLTSEVIKEKIAIAKEIVKELKDKDETYNHFERMIARNIYNNKLGIYN